MSDELIFLSRQTIPPAFVIEDLGFLPDGRISHASAINRLGHVVGDADTTDGMHGFLWIDGTMTDLGTLGGHISNAVDINDADQIIGLSERSHGEKMVPFLWQEGRMVDLEAHDLGPVQSLGGINEHCELVGSLAVVYTEGDLNIPGETAFRWQPGGMVRLTDLPVRWSEARAISDQRTIVGELYEPGIDRNHAFVWAEGRLIVLDAGSALDVNDHGVIAGFARVSPSLTIACVWTQNVRRDLPLPLGTAYSQATAINIRGDVVGNMGSSASDTTPFLWSRQHLIDLNDTIEYRSGWLLHEAVDINDAGQIVGWGFKNHRRHAFRMTPNAAG